MDVENLNDTILYGSLLQIDGTKLFVIDTIFYYKGEKISCSYHEKIKLFHM